MSSPRRTKLYTASKIRHAPLWRNRRALYYGAIEFTARWIDHDGPDHNTTFWTASQQTLHWCQDLADIQYSDFLLAYCEEGDEVKGTLVEIGAAIALSKPVLAIGFPSSHSWQSHPLVMVAGTVDEAFNFLIKGIF